MKIFDFSTMTGSLTSLLTFVPVTLFIVLISLVTGLILGFFLAWCKLGKNKALRIISNFYTEIIRGTPFLVLLFVIFYGLPAIAGSFGLDLYNVDKTLFMLITLSLFAASRLSEMMRSAYEAVDRTQREAAVSAGLTEAQALFHIIMPQAVYIALPNFGNIVVSVVLETSLGFTIGMIDILGQAKLINSWSYGSYTLEIYIAAALIYWALSLLISRGTTLIEVFLGRRMGLYTATKKERRTGA